MILFEDMKPTESVSYEMLTFSPDVRMQTLYLPIIEHIEVTDEF